MRKLMLVLLLSSAAAACGPECVKGHDETYIVPAHEEDHGQYVSNVWFPHNVTVPAHEATRFVCDEYRAKR